MHFFTLLSTAALAGLALAAPGKSRKHGKDSNSKCGSITPAYAKTVVSQFTTDGIIPDLIEATTLGTPKVAVNVTYGTKAVNLGTYFTIPQTVAAPTLSFTAEKGYDPYSTYYTYFLIDPDVPQDGSMVQVNFEHWAVTDAQPQCVKNQTPRTVVAYEPLTPLSTTQHRYTFLVYRQPPGFDLTLVQDALLQLRTPFDINNFAQDNKLVLVGGNFLKEAAVNGLQSGTGVTDTNLL